MEISNFNSQMRIVEVLNWIVEVKRIFNVMEIPNRHKVKLVAIHLKGRDFVWWDETLALHARQWIRPI